LNNLILHKIDQMMSKSLFGLCKYFGTIRTKERGPSIFHCPTQILRIL